LQGSRRSIFDLNDLIFTGGGEDNEKDMDIFGFNGDGRWGHWLCHWATSLWQRTAAFSCSYR
jgi:hypothetical protein